MSEEKVGGSLEDSSGGGKSHYYMSGGPLNSQVLYLASPGTLHIRLGNFAGKYVIHPDPLRVRTLLWLDD